MTRCPAPLVPVLVLAAALGAGGCGKKLAPEPPLLVIPARVEPLRLSQEGSDVVLRFPYPSRTAQGEELTNLSKVTVYREILPAPTGARPPGPPADAAGRTRDEKTFRLRSAVVLELSRGALDDATDGGEVVVRDSLLPLYYEKRLGRIFLRYGVTATRDKKRVSELSPLVALQPRTPPDRPLGLVALVEEKRVCLDWIRPERMIDGSKEVTVAGYAVYRREETEDAYEEPIRFETLGASSIDETALTGKRYLYTVRAAPSADRPLVLGPPADEVRADTRDVFPPPVPEGLLVLGEEGVNRLVWNPVLVPDLASYRVYRREAGGEYRLVAGDVKDSAYVDSAAPRGAAYAVTAVDRSGNESARAEAEERKR